MAFWRKASPFSNWYPVHFTCAGITYNCGEQLMMHRKALAFGDLAIAARILQESDPARLKALGRQVRGYQDDIWRAIDMPMVFDGLLAKFTQDQTCRLAMLTSGDKLLVEASPVDRIWGAGIDANDPRLTSPHLWPGQNRLGRVLMQVRQAMVDILGAVPAQSALF